MIPIHTNLMATTRSRRPTWYRALHLEILRVRVRARLRFPRATRAVKWALLAILCAVLWVVIAEIGIAVLAWIKGSAAAGMIGAMVVGAGVAPRQEGLADDAPPPNNLAAELTTAAYATSDAGLGALLLRAAAVLTVPVVLVDALRQHEEACRAHAVWETRSRGITQPPSPAPLETRATMLGALSSPWRPRAEDAAEAWREVKAGLEHERVLRAQLALAEASKREVTRG
jgi:hypothetical protein